MPSSKPSLLQRLFGRPVNADDARERKEFVEQLKRHSVPADAVDTMLSHHIDSVDVLAHVTEEHLRGIGLSAVDALRTMVVALYYRREHSLADDLQALKPSGRLASLPDPSASTGPPNSQYCSVTLQKLRAVFRLASVCPNSIHRFDLQQECETVRSAVVSIGALSCLKRQVAECRAFILNPSLEKEEWVHAMPSRMNALVRAVDAVSDSDVWAESHRSLTSAAVKTLSAMKDAVTMRSAIASSSIAEGKGPLSALEVRKLASAVDRLRSFAASSNSSFLVECGNFVDVNTRSAAVAAASSILKAKEAQEEQQAEEEYDELATTVKRPPSPVTDDVLIAEVTAIVAHILKQLTKASERTAVLPLRCVLVYGTILRAVVQKGMHLVTKSTQGQIQLALTRLAMVLRERKTTTTTSAQPAEAEAKPAAAASAPTNKDSPPPPPPRRSEGRERSDEGQPLMDKMVQQLQRLRDVMVEEEFSTLRPEQKAAILARVSTLIGRIQPQAMLAHDSLITDLTNCMKRVSSDIAAAQGETSSAGNEEQHA